MVESTAMPPSHIEAYGADAVAWLGRLEARLLRIAQAENPFVTEAAQHVLAAGGKRLRPLLVELASQLGGGTVDDEKLDAAALVVELTHVASLYHDDVMDEAVLRRGVASTNARYGNSVAILTGDYLFARASSLVATLGVAYVQRQADTFARMVQGQIAELKGPMVDADPMDHYLKVLSDKTAALISTSAVFGGMVGGLGDDDLARLDRFGEALGMAFQLHDDLLDITSDTAGKLPGTDLRQGVATLPLLMLRRSTRPQDQALAASIGPGMTDAEVAAAVAALRVHPVIDQARDVIAGYTAAADAELAALPASSAKARMGALVSDVTGRVRNT